MWTRNIKYFFQKVFRGWSDKETWNLDSGMIEYVYPRLKRLKEVTICYPPDLKDIDEWKKVIDKILHWMDFYRDKLNWDDEFESIDEYNKFFDEGLALFNKYWTHFWW